MKKVVINFARIQQPLTQYVENLVDDNGNRLWTWNTTPIEVSQYWSEKWQQLGLLDPGQTIGIVEKFMFYDRYFAIMRLKEPEGDLIGYYCDISTPLEKKNDEYFIQDLMLDLWIPSWGDVCVLDLDEFNQAVAEDLISAAHQKIAIDTLAWLEEQIEKGCFPGDYVD